MAIAEASTAFNTTSTGAYAEASSAGAVTVVDIGAVIGPSKRRLQYRRWTVAVRVQRLHSGEQVE